MGRMKRLLIVFGLTVAAAIGLSLVAHAIYEGIPVGNGYEETAYSDLGDVLGAKQELYINHNTGEKLYADRYELFDFDGDGEEELLLFTTGADTAYYWAIYDIRDGKVCRVARSSEMKPGNAAHSLELQGACLIDISGKGVATYNAEWKTCIYWENGVSNYLYQYTCEQYEVNEEGAQISEEEESYYLNGTPISAEQYKAKYDSVSDGARIKLEGKKITAEAAAALRKSKPEPVPETETETYIQEDITATSRQTEANIEPYLLYGIWYDSEASVYEFLADGTMGSTGEYNGSTWQIVNNQLSWPNGRNGQCSLINDDSFSFKGSTGTVNFYRERQLASVIQTGPKDSSESPNGAIDKISSGSGSIYIGGWAFDYSSTQTPLRIDVYIGGNEQTGVFAGSYTADHKRSDVGNSYGCGDWHGVSITVETEKYGIGTGQKDVYVYARNVGNGYDSELAHASVAIY